MADAMKAAAHRQPGGPEILRYEDVPDPVTAPGGVLVWGEAISTEGGRLLQCACRAGGGPHVAGYQCVHSQMISPSSRTL